MWAGDLLTGWLWETEGHHCAHSLEVRWLEDFGVQGSLEVEVIVTGIVTHPHGAQFVVGVAAVGALILGTFGD